MLRTNLASRPFYNDRLVGLLLVFIAMAAVALTAFNAQQLVTLSGQRSTLKAQIARDESAAARADKEALALQHTVDRAVLTRLAGATREANVLIGGRTFSWTIFFNQIEKTLPANVRLVSVAPVIDEGALRITMQVIAKRAEDAGTFMDALEATGAFHDAKPRERDRTDDGQYRVMIWANYEQPNATLSIPKPKARR